MRLYVHFSAGRAHIMRSGMTNAIIAYTIWGSLPLYWKWFEMLPAGEVLSHRIVWSFVFMGLLVALQKRWREMAAIFRSWKILLSFILSGLLISVNWFVFIWAVGNEHVAETSLGYYLNPLINVLLAVLFLHEKPNRGQWLAIALAGIGVLIVAIDYGHIPWVSLTLAFSFGLYALAKKRVTLDASIGLLVETLVVVPFALVYWGHLAANHQDTAWSLPQGSLILLMLSGFVTVMPLLFFARAARGLTLTTLGFVQYIGPTITLFISIWVFNEKISFVMLISFILVWIALVVYTMASFKSARRPRQAVQQADV